MEKERVNDEQALKLQTLGFNEECMFYLGIKQQIPIPLKQQVFRWFRDEHQIFASIETDCTSYPKFAIVINGFVGNPRDLTEKEWYWVNIFHSDLYRSYEEAESDCIDKLIEIVKKQLVN